MTDIIEGFDQIEEVPQKRKYSNFTCRRNQGPNQLETTLEWVGRNYEWSEGVCLPRCVLFQHYKDFCVTKKFVPVGPATFGKLLRMRFAQLTTRRLGARGQSRYHYYGIGIKEDSIYYKDVYNGTGLSRFSTTKVKKENSSRRFSINPKNGRILAPFPDVSGIVFENEEIKVKVETFMLMYRTHCQKILDTVISNTMEEVRKAIGQFYSRMSDQCMPVMSLEVVKALVQHCDVILYTALQDVLVPGSCVQDIPEALMLEVKQFASNLVPWLQRALEDYSEDVRAIKLEGAERFCRTLRRNLDFVHLARATKGTLIANSPSRSFHQDLVKIDISSVWMELSYLSLPLKLTQWTESLTKVWIRLVEMLSKPLSVEDLLEWLDTIIDSFVFQQAGEQCWRNLGWDFVLIWSYMTKTISRELTLKSLPSFAGFQIIQMMFDEYIQLVLESRRNMEINVRVESDLWKFYPEDAKITYELTTATLTKLDRGSPSFSTCSDGASCEDPEELVREQTANTSVSGDTRDSNMAELLFAQNQTNYVMPPPYTPTSAEEQRGFSPNFIVIDENYGVTIADAGDPQAWREQQSVTLLENQQVGAVYQQNEMTLTSLSFPFYTGMNSAAVEQFIQPGPSRSQIEMTNRFLTPSWTTNAV